MKTSKNLNFSILLVMLLSVFYLYSLAEENPQKNEPAAVALPEAKPIEAVAQKSEQAITAPAGEAKTSGADTLITDSNVTLDFKDADIRNVLRIISYKSGVNIVPTPEVMGNVTIRLVEVPWEKALDVIVKTNGFSYERIGNIITVAPTEKLTALKKQEVELSQVQPIITEVFNLKYIDAQDAKKAIEPQLSPRGKVTVLEMTGQAGWEFGAVAKGESDGSGKLKRAEESKVGRSKVIIVSEIPPVLDKIREVISQIDLMPKQILIEARIMEVNRDKLRDIGIDWATGATGAESASMQTTPAKKGSTGVDIADVAAHALGYQITPSAFGPKESTLTADNAGLKFLFKKLTGAQFEVILHALDEDVNTNTLSSPRIMALNNQEAAILIGTKYPILKSEQSGSGGTTVTNYTLDYYQDIGIQLNVVPQVGTDNYINMVVHPAVSSYAGTETSLTSSKYPIIEVREAETRVLMKDGETVVIGGLLKDVKNKETIGIPFLRDLPLLGPLFRRDTEDVTKIDLIIFITARIIKEGEYTPAEIAKLEERLGRGPEKEKAIVKKKKKR